MKSFEEIVLSETELNSITQYKTFGQSWIDKCIQHTKASNWIKLFLKEIENVTTCTRRCYVAGYYVYARQDGQPLTDADIEAVKFIDHGQANYFEVAEDKLTIKHRYECDSGD